MTEKHWKTVELTINGFTYPARYTEAAEKVSN